MENMWASSCKKQVEYKVVGSLLEWIEAELDTPPKIKTMCEAQSPWWPVGRVTLIRPLFHLPWMLGFLDGF